jgi:hypothetical protein
MEAWVNEGRTKSCKNSKLSVLVLTNLARDFVSPTYAMRFGGQAQITQISL